MDLDGRVREKTVECSNEKTVILSDEVLLKDIELLVQGSLYIRSKI